MKTKYYLMVVFMLWTALDSMANTPQEIKDKYAEVLKYFSQQSSDSLKYKAALFLIENISYHASVTSNKQDVYYSKLAEIENKYNFPMCQQYIKNLADSISMSEDAPFLRLPDESVVTSQYLIDIINDSFEKWQYGNFARHLNFAEFCECILPYKLTNERVEKWRAELFSLYKRGLESISPIDDKKYSAYWGASQINDIIKHDKIFIQNIPYIGNVNLPISVLKNLKMGTCNDYAFKAAYIMRACGVPVCVDFTPQWPTRPHGHHWNVVLDNSGKYIPFMGAESNPGYPCKDDYVVGKVYRYTYALQKQSLFWKNKDIKENVPGVLNIPFIKDVTPEYTKGSTVVLNLKGKNMGKRHFAYLAAFNNQRWVPLAFAEIKNEIAIFENVGRGAVYLPILWDGDFIPAGFPINVKENGDVKHMVPDNSKVQTIKMERKYPVFNRIYLYSKRMCNALFQVSSSSKFEDIKILARITRNPNMQMDSIQITSNSEQFRYLRYVSPVRGHCNVAELQFFDGNERVVPVGVSTDGTEREGFDGREALDNNNLTYYDSQKSDYAYINIDFGKPVHLTKIKYLPRNDDNYVKPGHKYRLDYYGIDGPRPIGVIKATSHSVVFPNVPSSALFILHDLTSGTEERIFEIENGQLVWH